MAESAKVACPHCSKSYTIRPDLLGKKTACKACGEQFVLQVAALRPAGPPPLPPVEITTAAAPAEEYRDSQPEKPKGFFQKLKAAVTDAAAAGAAAGKEYREKHTPVPKPQVAGEQQPEPHERPKPKSLREKWAEHQERLAEISGKNHRATDVEPPQIHLWWPVSFCGCSLSTDSGINPNDDIWAYLAERAIIFRKTVGFSHKNFPEILRIPLAEIEELTVETADRMTLGRIGVGYLLAGPFGGVIGGLWKKKDKFLRIDWSGDKSAVFGKRFRPGFSIDADALKQKIIEGIRQVREANGEQPEGMPKAIPAKPGTNTGDFADAIAKLAALRDQGLLTDEEFTAKKAELLSRI